MVLIKKINPQILGELGRWKSTVKYAMCQLLHVELGRWYDVVQSLYGSGNFAFLQPKWPVTRIEVKKDDSNCKNLIVYMGLIC